MTRTFHLSSTLLALLASACGSTNSPVGPSPMPPASGATHITGTITNTMTGAPVGTFTSEAAGFPARVSVSAPGYVTRETWVRSAAPTVDLIAESGFMLDFYRQFARGTLDGSIQPLRVLAQAPSIYLQTAGLSASNVAALEQAARAVVPALTGGKFSVSTFETGEASRAPSTGWIVVDIVNEGPAICGRAEVGTGGGHLWLNMDAHCAYQGNRIDPSVMAHELGHAFGYWHVSTPGALMSNVSHEWGRVVITEQERHHAAIAYHRSAGNLDVDSDPVAPQPLHAVVIE